MSLSDDDAKALLALAAENTEEVRYLPIETLGEGGMGKVVKVWDGRLLREVALKTLRPGAQDMARRFLREARITAQLEHPNVVPVYDLDDSEPPSFTMREIRGASLAELIERGELGRRGARLDVFRKVCDAMAYAHDCGVIHRDLKPSNVMVGRFGEVQVVDWGLARALGEPELDDAVEVLHGSDDRTRVGSISGTPLFWAPEQAVVGGVIDERTDIYGLGRLLACLLAGRVVKPDEAFEAPWELQAVVARATAIDAGDRYDNVLAMQADVAAWQEDLPLPTLRYPVASRLLKGLQRHRAVALASSLTGLAAGVVLAAAVYAQGASHVAELKVARDDAVAATLRAEHQLARAQLALAWSTAERGESAQARAHLQQAKALWGDPADVELHLAEAWLAAQVGRPQRRIVAPGTLGACYGPDGRDVLLTTSDGLVLPTPEGLTPLGDGNCRGSFPWGYLLWRDGQFELRDRDGGTTWTVPWAEEFTMASHRTEGVFALSDARQGTVVFDARTGEVLNRQPELAIVQGVADGGRRVLGSPVVGSTHRAPDATLLIDPEGVQLRLPGSSLARLSADGSASSG